MPIYDIRCVECGKKDIIFRSIMNFNDLPDCCGKPMERVISAPNVIPDIKPYKSMATGEMITSRSKHKQHLKDHKLIEIGDQHEAHQRELEQRRLEAEKKAKEDLRKEVAARIYN